MVKVTLNLPADLEQRLRGDKTNFDTDVTEVYVLELFRRGAISHFELSQVLGLGRIETDGWLKQHRVFEGSLSNADLEADRQTLHRVMKQSPPCPDAGGRGQPPPPQFT